MGPSQVLPLRARVDLGVVATKGWLHTPQSSQFGASPPDVVYSHNQDISLEVFV